MKKLYIIFFVILFLGFCSTVAEASERKPEVPVWYEFDEAIVVACSNSMARLETDPQYTEYVLKDCRDTFEDFYQEVGGVWPDSLKIHYYVVRIVKNWSDVGLKIFTPSMGCQIYGCKVQYQHNIYGGVALEVLKEEFYNQGILLREEGYNVPEE